MSQLNLRTILAGDNISAVVEKINYNFQQIALNGGGPQGDQGFIGPPGIPGPQGPIGPIGPTGGTGTYVYSGTASPLTVGGSLVPPPRNKDLYIQADPGTGFIYFWENVGGSATNWTLVATISASDGVFTTAGIVGSVGITAETAAYPRLDKASLLMISDYDSLSLPGQIFEAGTGPNVIHGWLNHAWIPWQSLFGGLSNQIRILNTDPEISGPSASNRNYRGAGMLLSLASADPGNTQDQVFSILSADADITTDDKMFVLSVNKGSTSSLFTDQQNRVSVYGSIDPLDSNNQSLANSLTVFGSEKVYDLRDSWIEISSGATNSGPSYSRLFMTKTASGLTGSTAGSWEFRLGSAVSEDFSLRLFGAEGIRNAQVLSAGISPLDDRGNYVPQVGIGMDDAIAQLEIGRYVSGRLGFGQISPIAALSNAAGYSSFNAFRGASGSSVTWTLRGDATHNGGAINWASSDGKTLAFLLMPSTGTTDRILTGDSFLESENPIVMKKILGSSSKLFIDSYSYTEQSDSIVSNAPQLVVGLGATTSPALFNFGNVSEGIGLHGITKGLEWVSGQAGASSTGFRFLGATAVGASGEPMTTHRLQYRSYVDSTWRDAITVISQDNATGGTYSGNVVIGATAPKSTVGKAKLTVVGNLGPTNGATAGAYLGGPQIVDFQTAGGTSMFTLDKDGNVVSGIRFGNDNYTSEDRFTLDHYEEGSWTPVLMPEGGTVQYPSWQNAYKVFKANYTRVGNKVKVDFTLKIDGLNAMITGPTGTAMYISGFPYRPDFERVSGVGANVSDPLNPSYPLVGLKSLGISDSGGAEFGQISIFGGTVGSLPYGWRICNGDELLKADYPQLYAAIGDTYYDPSRPTTNGNYFRIPDLRGYFVRGVNDSINGSSNLPNFGSVLGLTQSDMFREHSHSYQRETRRWGSANNGDNRNFNSTQIPPTFQTGTTGGSETRPFNMSLHYIMYCGGGASSVSSIGDLSGGFVLFGGAKTRMYLYDSLSTLDVNNLPYGVGASSMIFGSFEYFISFVKSLPVVSNGSYNFTIGDTSFSIPLMSLITSETPLTGLTVSGLASWMTFNSTTNTIEFNPPTTSVPVPQQAYNITVTATNSVGSASGALTLNVFTLAPPVVSGPSTINHSFGNTVNYYYSATNTPTSWSISPVDANMTLAGGATGATLTINSSFVGVGSYTVSATNASGTGSTVTNIASIAPTSLLYYTYNPSLAGSLIGTIYIDIYDNLNNLVASTSFYAGSAWSGSFTGTLNDGQSYTSVVRVTWNFISGTYAPSLSYQQILSYGIEAMDLYNGPNDYQSAPLTFTYNLSSPNTIDITVVTTP